jgi:hypothetical protein
MPDWTAIGGWVVAALTAAGGLYLNWRKAPAETRKTVSEARASEAVADETVGKAWATLYGEVRTRLAVVEAQNAAQAIEMGEMKSNSAKRDTRLAELERKMAVWLIGIRKLIDQIVGLGHVPVWSPDDDGHG